MKKAFLALLTMVLAQAPLWPDFGMTRVFDEAQALEIRPDGAFSIRFKPQTDMTLQSVSLYCLSQSGSMAVQLSVHGALDDVPLAQASLVPGSKSWAVFQFKALQLHRSYTYDFIIEPDPLRGGSHAVGMSSASRVEFAALRPALGKAMLKNSRGTWKPSGLEPAYLVRALHGQHQGQPYAVLGQASIHGNGTPSDLSDDLLQAQALHFHCGTQASSLRVRVRKVGQPQAPLELEVFRHLYSEHRTVSILKALAAKPEQATQAWQWLKVKLPGPTPLSFAPECHYFAFHSSAGRASAAGCNDCWQISLAEAPDGAQGAEELTFDAGAHRSRAATALQGQAWQDHFNCDLNLVVESSPCPEAAPVSLQPLPTPEYQP